MAQAPSPVEYLAQQLGLTTGTTLERARELERAQLFEFARGFWYYAHGSDAPAVLDVDLERYCRHRLKQS